MALPHANQPNQKHTIIVEHLDPELEDWQALEYQCIAQECNESNTGFLLSGLHSAAEVGNQLNLPATNLTENSVEALYASADQRQRVCLLDPKGASDLAPEDGEQFDVFLFGGILGDDPPQDRTGQLRKLGFAGRRLGAEQMTTDTAARVTRIVVQQKVPLKDIPYIDRPDIPIPRKEDDGEAGNPIESIVMPFKYVKGEDGKPIMPKGMNELLASDADKDILDLL